MPEGRSYAGQTGAIAAAGQMASRIGFDDLVRLPVRHLARLLLDRAAEDPTLLSRLYDSVGRDAVPAAAQPDANAAAAIVVGGSPAMRHVADLIRRFGQTDDPVLITGESGTGKELLAGAIHQASRRGPAPFVVVNCAAIPPGLVASELFGFEKGAFTGAVARGLGQIELAHGGTLFLDEIGDMPVDLQGHLLRFLQEGQIRRVGGRETMRLDVRIVAATNVRLGEAIADGRFRRDLFYRLAVLTVPVPPLRDRHDDIAVLADHFRLIAARDFGRDVDGFTPAAIAALRRHDWPGNVRELMSVVRRAVVVTDARLLDAADLGLPDASAVAPTGASPKPAVPRPGSAAERAILLRTLEQTNENVTASAAALGVSRVTLYRMLLRHRIALRRGLAEPLPAGGARHARP
jgi:transcriptional regulator with PAS, ATPase and Fis domain